MSFAAKSMMRSLAALTREADYELVHTIGRAHPSYGTFDALLASSNDLRPVGWFVLKKQARLAIDALQKDEDVDARIAFTLLLQRLDDADTPSSRGCSADVIILEEAAWMQEEGVASTQYTEERAYISQELFDQFIRPLCDEVKGEHKT